MHPSSRNAFLLLLLALAGCQREPAPATGAVPVAPARTPQAARGDAFTVEITFSTAARERLMAQRESVIVSADYFGEPGARALALRVPGSEDPWLALHRAQVELAGAQLQGTAIARFPAVAFDAKRLAWTDAPDAPQVNINVWSGRRSSADNLLDCGMFQDTLAMAARSPIGISCRLISESDTHH